MSNTGVKVASMYCGNLTAVDVRCQVVNVVIIADIQT